MLRFRQKKSIAVFVLLSLSLNSFADTGLKEKTSTNLVELFKVKAHATDHIKSIEAKLLVTNEADQEELLVELAQSLLYYQDRHNKVSNSKTVTSKEVSSLSAVGANIPIGKVSKLDNGKGPYTATKIYRKALNAYKKATKLSLNKNRIKYTRKLSELAVKLQNKNELGLIFEELLQHGVDEKGTYLAHVDYADGLAKFKDSSADSQFLSAIAMRTPVEGIEANFRYANYLLSKNKVREALVVLDKYNLDERRLYVHVAIFRQDLMHKLNMNTNAVDAEVSELRRNLSDNPFIRAIPKLVLNKTKAMNKYNLSTAYAFNFAHRNLRDDSRGKYSSAWVNSVTEANRVYSTHFLNIAEVVYNEARGASSIGRIAVGWAIRNRATMDMMGCDFYLGAEGHAKTNKCREVTSMGTNHHLYGDIYAQYACVVHGGTTTVGAINTEMNDSHVSLADLESSGIIWELVHVVNGWMPDPTSLHAFAPVIYPERNYTAGNPDGAQEWGNFNYCAENHACKVRLGNVGGVLIDPGDLCPLNGDGGTENFFWGRKVGKFPLIF